MVEPRMTLVEHAKQLVSHGAHAADIEVVEGLLAELEKSKKTIESLREFTRKQFGKEGTFDVVGGRDPFGRILVYTLPKLPTPTRHARPPLEQYDDVVPKGELPCEMVKRLRPEKVREGVYIAPPVPLTSTPMPDALDVLEERDSDGNLTRAVVTTSMPALLAAFSLGSEPLVLDSLSAIFKSQESDQ